MRLWFVFFVEWSAGDQVFITNSKLIKESSITKNFVHSSVTVARVLDVIGGKENLRHYPCLPKFITLPPPRAHDEHQYGHFLQ